MATKKPAAKKPADENTTISFRLTPQRLRELDALADRAGMTRSSVLQLAVDRILKQGL